MSVLQYITYKLEFIEIHLSRNKYISDYVMYNKSSHGLHA